MAKQRRKQQDHAGRQRLLLALCCAAYFAGNLGRASYSVTMVDMIHDGLLESGLAGLIGTGFFACYGVGQLACGFLGDRVSPRWFLFAGLAASTAANLLMAVAPPAAMLWVWCLNGLSQSSLWAPVVRIVAEYYSPRQRVRAMIWLSAPYPAAMLVSYLGGAAALALFNWRVVFFVVAAVMAAAAVLWLWAYPRLSGGIAVQPVAEAAARPGTGGKLRAGKPLAAAFALVAMAMVLQGMLRDGVTTWVPSYLSGLFGAEASLAVLSTTLLPVLNLAGPVLARWLYKRPDSEAGIAALFYLLAAAGAALLVLAGHTSYWLSVACLALITSSTTGINMMFVSLAPVHFAKWRRVAAVSGCLNAMVYLGSSVSSYGFGAIAKVFGWQAIGPCLLAIALLGGILCLGAARPWKRALDQNGI